MPKALKSCPNSNKSPNLVTLHRWSSWLTQERSIVRCEAVGDGTFLVNERLLAEAELVVEHVEERREEEDRLRRVEVCKK